MIKYICPNCKNSFEQYASFRGKCCSWKCRNEYGGINAGEKHGLWKGGRTISGNGYILIQEKNHPRASKIGKYVAEHILVMEKHIGRFLSREEVVHHKNHIKKDNRIENLELTTPSKHMKHHPALKPFKKGEKHSHEHNRKVSESKRKWWANRKASLPREKWANR